jgi:HAMP domain-containing protein
MKKRHLIPPTIFSIVFIALLTDYLYFRASPWSPINLISKIVSILGLIFSPVVNPALYAWVVTISVPAAIFVVAVTMLFIANTHAKSAMREATPDPKHPELMISITTPRKYIAEPVQGTLANRREVVRSAFPQLGLQAKLILSFGAIGVVFGVLAWMIAQTFISQFVENAMKSRAELMTLNLSEIASRSLADGEAKAVSEQIAIRASNDIVAYIYVEDSRGQIVICEPKDLPLYLKRNFPISAELALGGIQREYRGFGIYELVRRLTTDNGGFVHLALWRNQMALESRPAAVRVAAALVFAVLLIVSIFALILSYLIRPFLELVRRAERISAGDLTLPLGIKTADDVGEIARSLERIRASLRAASRRLDQPILTEDFSSTTATSVSMFGRRDYGSR